MQQLQYGDVNLTVTEQRAMDILENGNPMKFLLDVIGRYHVGDVEAAKAHILSVISCCNDTKIHILTTGRSGGGKTHLQETILDKIVPEENRYDAKRVSPKALFYKTKPHKTRVNGKIIDEAKLQKPYDFNKKIIMLDDQDEHSKEILKVLGSQTPPSYETVINGESVLLKLNANPVIWWNKVTPITDEDQQIPSRYYYCNVDEGRDHQEKVAEFCIKWNLGKIRVNPKDLDVARYIIKTVINSDVTVSLSNVAELCSQDIPTKEGRNISYFIAFLKCYTRLFQYQRERVEVANATVVYSDIEDYEFVKEMWQKNTYQELKIDSTAKFILDNCIEDVEPELEEQIGYTVSDITEKFNSLYSGRQLSESSVRLKLKSLYDMGYIKSKRFRANRGYYYWK